MFGSKTQNHATLEPYILILVDYPILGMTPFTQIILILQYYSQATKLNSPVQGSGTVTIKGRLRKIGWTHSNRHCQTAPPTASKRANLELPKTLSTDRQIPKTRSAIHTSQVCGPKAIYAHRWRGNGQRQEVFVCCAVDARPNGRVACRAGEARCASHHRYVFGKFAGRGVELEFKDSKPMAVK